MNRQELRRELLKFRVKTDYDDIELQEAFKVILDKLN